MKNVFVALCSLFLFLSLPLNATSATPDNEGVIEAAVAAIKSACPIKMAADNNVQLVDVSYLDKTVVYDYSVTTIDSDVSASQFKKSMVEMLIGECRMSAETKYFFTLVAETGGQVKYNYTSRSGKNLAIVITNEELKKALSKL